MTYSPDPPATARPVSPASSSASVRMPVAHTEGDRALEAPYLQIENVHKRFGSFVALRDIYLDVYPGEFVCLLGPSGCGKTTLLRIIAGLEQQTSGRVIQAGRDVSSLPPAKRDFGIVFQSYALFPNLTAAQNIAYGLQNAKMPKAQIDARVAELLETVGLAGFGAKYPAQLSGGQQQRVALARALALSPGLLLLDEPLSALDAQVRVRLRTEIAQLQKRLGITTIMVTHDQAEALAMADRAVVMDKGYIAQVGTPHSIYQRPTTPFVANFIGVMNFLRGVVASSGQVRCGNLLLDAPRNEFDVNTPVQIAIRPENVKILPQKDAFDSSLPNVIAAELEEVEFLGSGYRIGMRLEGDAKDLITSELPADAAELLDLQVGAALVAQLPPDCIQVFAQEPVRA
ncbi:putative 2-aminoethylphosphonate ABC transporter ATP-binding protein [Thermoleptolyngbya oregonensis NK1-22]|uniref:ABC-type quaternary amine transporter n=1 Tax=Thermoleptolyngbya oregonensis NK1-22 TaxID=2547457 RepID=A0AA97BCZ0_9CYAN|nr:putative 2-aminoethylphosphonate ABC transporter ATP-binding protein [Thermoleptolyngbya oregonensis]WOB43331.1 putative 2-aminoethylphosphonate ABC transporter ATP-binding protein [Thermoleptolyngbya oregonensis NK1-22]